MTKKIITNHTALAIVTSHGSGGRAEIHVGHPALVKGFRDPSITSARFMDIEIGEPVIMEITLRGKRRQIVHVAEAENIKKDITEKGESFSGRTYRESFLGFYGDRLKQQSEEYDLKHSKHAHIETTKGTEKEPIPTMEEESTSEWATKIYIPKEDDRLFNSLRTISDSTHVSAIMVGESGYGKTTIPQEKARQWGMNFLRWDCANVRDPEEFFGFRGAREGSTMQEDGSTIFLESKFTEVLTKGNCVIILDEINRIDATVSNVLFPLLDHSGRTNIAGHEIVVGPNVIFIATVNMGHKFAGTFAIDAALMNRFLAKVLVGPLPPRVEEKILRGRCGIDSDSATKIVSLMSRIRRTARKEDLSLDASTRVSIQIGTLFSTGLSLKECATYTLINGLSSEEKKLMADIVNSVL